MSAWSANQRQVVARRKAVGIPAPRPPTPTMRDRVINGQNVYLERFLALGPGAADDRYDWMRADNDWKTTHDRRMDLNLYEYRHKWVKAYSWAIPTDEALATIAQYSPNGVLETGAGIGYWAALLRAGGLEVIATDINAAEENGYHTGKPFTMIEVMDGVTAVKRYQRNRKTGLPRTLLLVWPPYNEIESSYDVIKAFRGDRVIYVGEGYGGCTGSDPFHAHLEARFEEVAEVIIPQWWGIHDTLRVYERKAVATRMQKFRCYHCGHFQPKDQRCDACLRKALANVDGPAISLMAARLEAMNRGWKVDEDPDLMVRVQNETADMFKKEDT